MKKLIRYTTLALAAGLLIACSSTGGSSTAGNSSSFTRGVKPYPLKTCLVTGNDLDSMGGERRIVHEGQEVKFCCNPCVAKFKKNPSKYLAQL